MTKRSKRAARPRVHAVILAGGAGERFWPASRRHRPKPFLEVVGGQSLLEATLSRARRVVGARHANERVWIVCGHEHAAAVRKESGLPRSRVLVEPERRNTAMACAWAALRIQAEDPDAVLTIMPADHHVPDEGAFAKAIETAAAAAAGDDGWLVTLGVQPTRPDTGYGYIREGKPLGRPHSKLSRVERFEEKPDRAKAVRYVAQGGYTWNAGVFVWSAGGFLRELALHAPEIDRALDPLRRRPRSGSGKGLARAYSSAPSAPVDTAIMEKSRRVATLPVRFAWSDVGTWASLADELGVGEARAGRNANGSAAPNGNRVIAGELVDEDAHGNLVWGGDRLVALLGVEGLAVIDSDDVILVTHLERSQDVKRFVTRLKERGRSELT